MFVFALLVGVAMLCWHNIESNSCHFSYLNAVFNHAELTNEIHSWQKKEKKI